MSRSNPTQNNPSPCERWIEWNGEKGLFRYYDKLKEAQIEVPLPFTFILLDQLATIKGWDQSSESGIFSNEVRDTRSDRFLVKSFKGQWKTEGYYSEIKDEVAARGGYYVTNCYVAFKNEAGDLALGSVQFKGAALRSWMEFCKEHNARNQKTSPVYNKAVSVAGFVEGKKGKVVFRTPQFKISECSPQTHQAATGIDVILQEYLAGYFERTTVGRVESESEPANPARPEPEVKPETLASNEDDVPF